jgi:hypothetical protein
MAQLVNGPLNPVENMAWLICTWAYADSLVRLDERKLRQCIVDDIGATGSEPLGEDECELFVCANQDDPGLPALKARFPKTDTWLEEQLT